MRTLSNNKYNPSMINIQAVSILSVNTFLTKMFHVKHWDRVETERKQKLQREYQEMEDIAQKIEKDREEFRRIVDRVLNNPIDRFIDEVAVPVFVFATFKHPAPACVSLAATARVVAPRIGQVATALGTAEISRDLTTFFNKKAGSELGKKPSMGDAPRVQATRGDADRYLQGLKDRGVIGKKGITKDGHDFFRIDRKCEYNGFQFKKGDYISRDELHHEWEYFSSPKTHEGAINSLTGKLDVSKAEAGRFLKLP